MIAAAPYLVWGLVLHLIADWLFQNEWMSVNKAKRRVRVKYGDVPQGDGTVREPIAHSKAPWWDRHPAAYVHGGIHGAIQLLIFPWWAALFIGITHLLIDTRKPVEWWSKLIRQTQPNVRREAFSNDEISGVMVADRDAFRVRLEYDAFDFGTEVRFWTDQVFHIAVVAIAALAVIA